MAILHDKVAVITGAASGIGKEAALLFAREGARVVVADKNSESGKEAVAQINEVGAEAVFIECDVSSSSDVRAMVQTAVDSFGALHILCNNAAVVPRPKSLADQPEDVWDPVIDVNLRGVFLGMKYAIPRMQEQGGGAICNTASAQAVVGVPHVSPYAASKGGIIALTRTAAVEYARHNIRINCIAPGMVNTPMLNSARAGMPADSVEARAASDMVQQLIPLGRIGEPEEIAAAMMFLVSDLASYITGHVLVADGGFSAQ